MLDPRYASEKMRALWSEDSKFATWGVILQCAARASLHNKVFEVGDESAFFDDPHFPTAAEVRSAEDFTHHELGAFLHRFSADQRTSREERIYIHYGLTSSDVIDTAQAIRIRQSSFLIVAAIKKAKTQLENKITETIGLSAVGRTHGQAAETIRFSSRFERALDELRHAESKFNEAVFAASLCMLSGPTGKYEILPKDVEIQVAKWLGLAAAHSAYNTSQVLPRILIVDLMVANASLASAIESITTQLRLLSLSEVGEVSEGFSSHQVSSSSMPHKRNPVANENLCGMARQVRSYVPLAFENVPLWHERDMSHSCVERSIVPDSMAATEYMLTRFAAMLDDLEINEENIAENLKKGFPAIHSFGLLSLLVRKGYQRDIAHEEIAEFMTTCDWQSPDELYREEIFVEHFAATYYIDEDEIRSAMGLK